MAFPLLFGLLGLGSLLAPAGMAKTAAGAISLGKNIYDQINLSDPTLKERALAAVPFEAGRQVEKGLGSLFGIDKGGGGGGGGDGDDGDDGSRRGTDFFGRPFFDPGLGSPAQNIQVTDPTGGRVQPVTTENLSVPDDFGFSDAELSQNIDFFNQGGLVSLLPRRATPAHSPPISYRRY